MKKLIMRITACLLLAPGLAAAKDKTFNGEIMDSQCAKMEGTNQCSRRKAPMTLKRVLRPA
jgi:hypothetical protein